MEAIFEAKVVGGRGALRAIREAVGQLYEYRFFIGPRTAQLCVLLDERPSKALVDYVEKHLALSIAWLSNDKLEAGPTSRERLLHDP